MYRGELSFEVRASVYSRKVINEMFPHVKH